MADGTALAGADPERRSAARDVLVRALFAAALAVFAARGLVAASIYTVTVDEPVHIGAGIELLQYGTYTVDPINPPLSRLIMAAPLYAAGLRYGAPPREESYDDCVGLLYDRTRLEPALFVARAAIVATGVVLLAALYAVATELFGVAAGLLALWLASLAPTLVGLSALATTDVVGAGTLLAALHFWRRLVVAGGGGRRAAAAGAAIGLAVLAKISSVPFLVLALPLILVWERGPRALVASLRRPLALVRAHAREAAAVLLAAALVLWAGYGFTLEPIAEPRHAEETARWLDARSPALGGAYRALAAVRVPLRDVVRAVRKAAHNSRAGHAAYLGGAVSQHGWARYYLVTTALKEPLGLLVAAGLAVALAARRRREPAAREVLLLALLAGGVLLAASTGGVNIGHRYVLATEPLLALVVAGGARLAAAEPRTRARAAALAVFVAGSVATAASSLGAHPDALGYTNALAGRAPDRWLVDSNLDWGQDLDRLAAWLRERGVEGPVRVAYFGLARVERHVPGAVALAPRDVAPGWVAISVTKLREGEEADPAAYAWLLSLEPVARIGTSILVYRVTPEHAARLRAGG